MDESATQQPPESGFRAALLGITLGVATAAGIVAAAAWWVWDVLEGARAPASGANGREVVHAFARFLESAGAPRELTSADGIEHMTARAGRVGPGPDEVAPAQAPVASLPPSLAALSADAPVRRWLSLSGGVPEEVADDSTRSQLIEAAVAGGEATVQEIASGLTELGEDAWQERAALLDLAAAIGKAEGGQPALAPSLAKVLAQEAQRVPSSQDTAAARDHVARVVHVFFELNRSEEERAQFVTDALQAQARPEIRAVLEAYAPKAPPADLSPQPDQRNMDSSE